VMSYFGIAGILLAVRNHESVQDRLQATK